MVISWSAGAKPELTPRNTSTKQQVLPLLALSRGGQEILAVTNNLPVRKSNVWQPHSVAVNDNSL